MRFDISLKEYSVKSHLKGQIQCQIAFISYEMTTYVKMCLHDDLKIILGYPLNLHTSDHFVYSDYKFISIRIEPDSRLVVHKQPVIYVPPNSVLSVPPRV